MAGNKNSGRTAFTSMGKPGLSSQEFIKRMSIITGVPQVDMRMAYNAFIAVLRVELENGREVKLNGIGKFRYKRMARRRVRHLITRQLFTIPANGRLEFNPTGPMKKIIFDVTKEKLNEDS